MTGTNAAKIGKWNIREVSQDGVLLVFVNDQPSYRTFEECCEIARWVQT